MVLPIVRKFYRTFCGGNSGAFAGVPIEQYFNKIKRFYPKNQWLAFLYGAILPVCSCGVLPLIDSMKKRTSLKTIITFVIAAPLLNPYIMLIAFTVLGWKCLVPAHCIFFSAFFIAGWLLEVVSNRYKAFSWGEYQACGSDCDFIPSRDPFIKTALMTRKLVPYILAAGLLGFIFALINPKQFLDTLNFFARTLVYDCYDCYRHSTICMKRVQILSYSNRSCNIPI